MAPNQALERAVTTASQLHEASVPVAQRRAFDRKGGGMTKWALFIIVLFSSVFAYSQEAPEINTILMRSTFMLTGPGSTGTAFIVGKPTKEVKDRAYFVLVTAAHVLNEMKGDNAVLVLPETFGRFLS